MRTSPVDTPLMRQYLEIKERHPDAFVFFRLGDFYELFFEDAVEGARLLELTLTTRDKGREDAIPMCGVPHHAARGYVARLLELGRKVVLCEQVEDPRLAKGLVRREVVRIITPGCVIDEEQLDAKQSRYLGALVPEAATGRFGLAYLELTTGELRAAELAGEQALLDELSRVAPRELLLGPDEALATRPRLRGICLSEHVSPAEVGDDAAVGQALTAELAAASGEGPDPEALRAAPLAARAALRALSYARATQPAGALPPLRLALYRAADFLVLDETTIANLELFETLAERRKRGSLLGVIDETCTAMGGRALRRWVAFPLRDVAAIRRRLDAVELLVERPVLRAALRRELAEVYDLERLAGRARLGVASPRDLAALRRSLDRLPPVALLLGAEAAGALAPAELLAVPEDLCQDVAEDVAATLVDEPPAAWREAGGAVRRGASRELDEATDLAEGGKGRILEIEVRERERTGIASLKIRYNKVFGYFLEVTRSNLRSVPADYVRKQTLANAERYVTPELAEHEARVLGAEERRVALEQELIDALRRRASAQAPRLAALAERVAALDALASLAEAAAAGGYGRPEVDESTVLEIDEGRHPVVERLAAPGGFVPNDVVLDPDSQQLLVITGPNMAGKSTVMRQVALIAVLAHVGSFVPARRARVGILDRIFTRVGAGDNLARGESTFMVEMRETANILRHATRRSLVVLDEIGRGTSTFDGVSIAWAVAEHLHDRIGAKTLFATHYHELTGLAGPLARVRNFSVAVKQWKGEVVFLRRLVPGGANRSYGIEVARLAGLPGGVIDRARAILAGLEGRDVTAGGPTAQLGLFGAPAAAPDPTAPPSADEGPGRALAEALAALPLDELSPLAALNWLADWKRRLV